MPIVYIIQNTAVKNTHTIAANKLYKILATLLTIHTYNDHYILQSELSFIISFRIEFYSQNNKLSVK